MVDELVRVKRAATTKRRSEESYRAALLDAHAAGCDFGKIAVAAGTTRQAVRQLIGRANDAAAPPTRRA